MTTTPLRRVAARSWSLHRRLGRSFVLLAAVLLVLTVAVVTATAQFALAGNAVIYRWQPAMSADQRALTDLVNQETGVRGYLLTGQLDSLQPYTDFVAIQRKDVAELDRLVRADGQLAAKLDAFRTAAARWQREVAGPLIVDVGQGRRPGVTALDAGRQRFDEIRASSAELSARLADRARQAREARTTAGYVAIFCLGAALAVIVAAGVALWIGLRRWVLTPVESLGAQTRLVASVDVTRRIDPDGPSELTSLGRDVELMRAQIVLELARAEEISAELRSQGAELERSNADLQQFAYVASHDLSEPLRKVANFCQLLERQYGPQLDDRAHQYIDFAVDGAKRMQVLITDLLALSRIGRSTEHFVAVDLTRALDEALATLSDRIETAGAVIRRPAALPTVAGDRTLLTSLLENLVGNAVKYHREGVAPEIDISAEHDAPAQRWTFTVCDNGIGIDAQYAERIFFVFQRLHLRDQFGGTGIGLALCRRIVEFHGGRVWLDTVESREGATFRFTLPEGEPGAQPPR